MVNTLSTNIVYKWVGNLSGMLYRIGIGHDGIVHKDNVGRVCMDIGNQAKFSNRQVQNESKVNYTVCQDL